MMHDGVMSQIASRPSCFVTPFQGLATHMSTKEMLESFGKQLGRADHAESSRINSHAMLSWMCNHKMTPATMACSFRVCTSVGTPAVHRHMADLTPPLTTMFAFLSFVRPLHSSFCLSTPLS